MDKINVTLSANFMSKNYVNWHLSAIIELNVFPHSAAMQIVHLKNVSIDY